MDTAKRLKTVFYFILWFALNALFNIYNKRVLDIVHLPWIVTFVQLATGFVFILPLWCLGQREKPDMSWNDWRWLLPIGIYHALSSVGGVCAISSGPVSTFQVLKALEPINSAFLAAVFYKHFFPCNVYATILVVVYGVIHACSKGDMHISVTMFAGTMISMIGASMRSLHSKQEMKNKKISPANLFAMMNAFSLLLLFPFMFLDAFKLSDALQEIQDSGQSTFKVAIWTFLSGIFFYTNNEVAFFALNQVHPVTHAVGNIFRRILIILASVMFLGDRMTRQNIVGAGIAIVGVFLYSLAKHQASTVTSSGRGRKSAPPNRKKMRSAPVPTLLFIALSLLLVIRVFFLNSTEWLVAEKFGSEIPEILIESQQSEEDQSEKVLQPMAHFLRANDVQLHEMVHLFNRMEELRMNNNISDRASGMVLCFSGLNSSSANALAEVWIQKLDGTVGAVQPSPLASHDTFFGCDVIVTAGGTYRSTASWAFKSSIPVVNLWNEDGYLPQAAMLFVHELFAITKQPEENHTAHMLNGMKAHISQKVSKNIRENPSLMAFRELKNYFRFKFDYCVDDMCHLEMEKIEEIAGPSLTSIASELTAAIVELALAKTGSLPMSYRFPGIRCEPGFILAGKVNEHDPNFAYSDRGSILFNLQWERVSKAKFSIDPETYFAKGVVGFKQASSLAKSYAVEEFNVSTVDLLVLVRSSCCLENGVTATHKERCGGRLKKEFCKGERELTDWLPNVPIVYQEQLRAHAIHGFLDSPFDMAIVVASHGAGSEPYSCAVYLAKRSYHPVLLNLCGASFDGIGWDYSLTSMKFKEVSKPGPTEFLSAPGVFMGYSGLGKPLPCMDTVKELLFSKRRNKGWNALALIELVCKPYWKSIDNSTNLSDFPRNLPIDMQRDVARTYEELFELSFLHILEGFQEELGRSDGIVFAGGSALNVKLSQRTRDFFDKPVWIASAPSDDGLGVGGAWGICHPPRNSIPLQYHGLPLLDKEDLIRHVHAWGTSCQYLGFDEEAAIRLARLLAVEKMIVAVVIGNQEFGPRALSHRSLMAYPDSIEIRDRMNALKHRQFYRPTCPTVAEEFVDQMFVRPQNIRSPFMSFAPELQDWVKIKLPAVRHFDDTARPQTLSASTEPFIHSMLQSIPKVKEDGKPVVINTSFNIKGQPIINTAEDSLFMLCSRPQLDYLFIEGYLFSLPGNTTHPACNMKVG